MKNFTFSILLLMLFQTIHSQNIVSDTILHDVERKETLFSISKRYGINVNDILKLNPNLRDSRLRRRSTILIPIFKSNKEKRVRFAQLAILGRVELGEIAYRVI